MAVIQSIKALLESLSFLLEQHLKLFQKELSDELRTLLGSFFGFLICLLPLIFGYVFVNIGVVFLLRVVMPMWIALLVGGACNFALGGLGVWWGLKRLKTLEFVPETLKELFVTRQAILQSTEPVEEAEERESVCEDAASRVDDRGT